MRQLSGEFISFCCILFRRSADDVRVRGREGNEERINDTEEISVAFWELLELFSVESVKAHLNVFLQMLETSSRLASRSQTEFVPRHWLS
jgi:hypothetical protein